MYKQIAFLDLGSDFAFEVDVEFSCVTNEVGDCPQFDCFWEEIEKTGLKIVDVLLFNNDLRDPGTCFLQLGSCTVIRGYSNLRTLEDINVTIKELLNTWLSDWKMTNCKITI